jgi:hypothetical protein
MEETITIISAAISLVTLIVFFVMAYNISKIVKGVKDLKQAGFLFMNKQNINTRRCQGCKTNYYSDDSEREFCPHCGYLNINRKSK